MTHNNELKTPRSRFQKTSQPAIGLTAAMLALMAGAPAGLAQTATDEGAAPGGFGSLMNFLGGDLEADADAQDQPSATDEFRTDGVYYDENATVELHVQDEDLTNVLQMLSIQSERNIVASSDVSARVTANLYGVTFHEALDAILHVNGYGYIERGNFIYVYPIDVLEQIEQASRQRVSQVVRLNFLNAVDAADFVNPLLSAEGEIKSNGKIGAWTDPTSPTGNEEFANESTLVIYDYPENIESIVSLLGELDTRPAQILVEATIVQTQINEQNAFGVDFAILADLDFAEFFPTLGAVDRLISGGSTSSPFPDDGEGSAITSNPGNTSGPATFKAGIVDNDVAVFLRVLDEVTDTTIISNPKVVTLNRQPGRVLVGRKVGYLQTTATDTSTTQTVEFLDTGTQLNFRPFVTSEGVIRMELKPQVSEASLRSATDASGVAVTIPDEITNELSANVLVPDGHTIVLGGLFREATTATRRQVPVLGDIPILGAAFKGHEDDVQRQEIIFLITPSIVSDQVLVDQGLRGEDSIRRVRAGAREGTLPFSRSRQAAQLLVEAEHLEVDGKTNQALHKARRALQLQPNYADAVEVRERLVNEKDVWPTGSLLEGIIHEDAEQLQHNILRHGWWGNRDKLSTSDAGTSQAQPAHADTYSASAARNASPASLPAEVAGSAWWDSAEFQDFMRDWDAAAAADEGRTPAPDDYRWTSNDFMSFWNSAVSENSARGARVKESIWSNPGFMAFLEAWGQNSHADAQSSYDANPGAWWKSEEFQRFMRDWDAALARKQGRDPAPAKHRWTAGDFNQLWSTAVSLEQHGEDTENIWSNPDFIEFLRAWATGEEGTPTSAGRVSASEPTSNPPANRGRVSVGRVKASNEEGNNAEAGFDSNFTEHTAENPTESNPDNVVEDATVETETDSEMTLEPTDGEQSSLIDDGRVPLYEDNPYVYYPSETDVPTDFEPESFEEAVAEMNTEDGADVDQYLRYLQDTESDTDYTEVPEDPDR